MAGGGSEYIGPAGLDRHARQGEREAWCRWGRIFMSVTLSWEGRLLSFSLWVCPNFPLPLFLSSLVCLGGFWLLRTVCNKDLSAVLEFFLDFPVLCPPRPIFQWWRSLDFTTLSASSVFCGFFHTVYECHYGCPWELIPGGRVAVSQMSLILCFAILESPVCLSETSSLPCLSPASASPLDNFP